VPLVLQLKFTAAALVIIQVENTAFLVRLLLVRLFLVRLSGECAQKPRQFIPIYRVSQEGSVRLRENVPYIKVHQYNPKHLYPKLNGYGDNGQQSLKV
jgi:hypothetical protein